MHLSGRSRGGARETRPAPLFLDQTIFFGDQAPLLWMTPPPPPTPLSEGLDPPLYLLSWYIQRTKRPYYVSSGLSQKSKNNGKL